MKVALSDLKVNVGKYDNEPWYLKKVPTNVSDVEQLFGTLPDNISYDDLRMERLLNDNEK